MDWVNPVEWVAWFYGKFFQNNATVGGFVVVALFALLGFVLWVRGVDKYKEEHRDLPKQAPSAQQIDPTQTDDKSAPDSQQDGKKSNAKPLEIPAKKAKGPTGGSGGGPTPPSGMIVRPGAAVSFGQQGGITAGTININATPPPPKLSDAQQGALRDAFAKSEGGAVEIMIDRPTDETTLFAQRLFTALSLDPLNPPILESAQWFIPSSNCQRHVGIWMIIGENRMNTANALAISLRESGVVQGQVRACADKQNPDKLTIVVSSN